MNRESIVSALKKQGFVVSSKKDVVLFTNIRNGQTYCLSFEFGDDLAMYRHAGFKTYIGKIGSIVKDSLVKICGEHQSVYIPRG